MTDRMNKELNRSKKGISPVVATVILVAVAVVIAAALAGFSGSLFGTYSSTGSVSVRTMTINADGDGTLVLVNRGALSDSVTSIHVPGELSDGTTPRPALTPGASFDAIYLESTGICPGTASTPPEIAANSEGTICFIGADMETTAEFTSGQQMTVKIKMTSGAELTQSITVAP